MYVIEPCCASRHLMLLRDKIGKSGTMDFEGYGDLSLTELLPAILTRYTETEVVIAAPSLPDQAAEAITAWMNQQWSRRDGGGKLNAIRHLTVIAGLGRWKSPAASQWLRENPWGERLTLVDRQQEETAILLPDFAITGPVNMRYGNPFTATATTDPDAVAALWAKYASPSEPGQPAASEKPVAAEPTDGTEKADAQEKADAAAIPEPKRRNGRKTAASQEA